MGISLCIHFWKLLKHVSYSHTLLREDLSASERKGAMNSEKEHGEVHLMGEMKVKKSVSLSQSKTMWHHIQHAMKTWEKEMTLSCQLRAILKQTNKPIKWCNCLQRQKTAILFKGRKLANWGRRPTGNKWNQLQTVPSPQKRKKKENKTISIFTHNKTDLL